MNVSAAVSAAKPRIHLYFELTKARLVSLVLLSTAVGFYLGTPGAFDGALFGICLLGTSLVAAGSMALNQWMERVEDGRMNRTAGRPLPSSKLHALEAFVFGTVVSGAGLAVLFICANFAAGLLAALTLFFYILLYTPLKKTTSLCTIVGAVPGALPPLIGWAAAAGTVTYQAWILFAIIFLWQMPHFLAIAWMYRREYAAAGFQMLSVTDPSGRQPARQIVLYAASLLPVSLLPSLFGMEGPLYFFGAFIMGAGFIALGIASVNLLNQRASWIFRASLLHLTGLQLLLVFDKIK